MQQKMLKEVSGDIKSDMKLTADTDWLLKGVVKVHSGATLTIEKGTTVYGDKDSLATLVIKQGAKIDAAGTKDEPIVFTSKQPAGQRASGDWGGLIVLGNAPINTPGGKGIVEGLTTDESYGGNVADDDSGRIQYVRIEFSGILLSPDNEVNGLTLAGVGSKTKVDHVMVKQTLDDCFEFFGGTVNAKYLVCDRNGDDGFDMDKGYVGKLQFLFLQQTPNHAEDDNGLEVDNNDKDHTLTPVTSPTVYNVTLCGQKMNLAKQQYGLLWRRGAKGTLGNLIATGFEAGIDLRDKEYGLTLKSGIFFDNAPEVVAYAEDGTNTDTQKNDDYGFDERKWFNDETSNKQTDPKLGNCFAETPDPLPASEIAGATPPSDGFFSDAKYVGAFKDKGDDWMTGKWVDWSQN
jgi:hypothetical protein